MRRSAREAPARLKLALGGVDNPLSMGRARRLIMTVASFAVLVAGLAAVATWSTEPVGTTKRERWLSVEVGMDAKELPAPNWIARDASIGVRLDERRHGLLLKHQVLTLRSVAYPPVHLRTARGTLVYTDAGELESRINDVLDGTVRVNAGADGTFAIGKLVVATLVKLDPKGRVRDVQEVRVSFVSMTHDRDIDRAAR